MNFRQLPPYGLLTSKPSKKKAKKTETTSANLEITFIDVTDGAEAEKKESYINQAEAEAVVEYYINNIQDDSEYVS